MIPEGRPVIGEDLDELREQLGMSTADACYMYGMSMTKWMVTTKKGAKSPVRNATLALLVRTLSDHPEASPLSRMPRPNDIFPMIREHLPGLDKKRMAIMFGCEASSGYRWIKLGANISPALGRLFMVFNQLHESAALRSDSAAEAMLKDWDRMVESEATARGIDNIFSLGRWKVGKKIGRPVIWEDLDTLREQLALSTADACWLFGMSMTKWMNEVKHAPKEPVRNASLSLLVRVLNDHPELSPVPPRVRAQDIFSMIQEHMPTLDKKRMAIMFGCEASSGYRWITMGSRISPALERTFRVFKNRLEAEEKQSEAAARAFLKDWDRMVEAEASARGVERIFSVGRWTQGEEDEDSSDEPVARAARKSTKPKPASSTAKLARVRG